MAVHIQHRGHTKLHISCVQAMRSQHYRPYKHHFYSHKNEGGRRPPQRLNYSSGCMTCNVGCTWLIYSLCAALYGLYAGYVWPSVTISGSIKIGIVTPSSDSVRFNQLSCTAQHGNWLRVANCLADLAAACLPAEGWNNVAPQLLQSDNVAPQHRTPQVCNVTLHCNVQCQCHTARGSGRP